MQLAKMTRKSNWQRLLSWAMASLTLATSCPQAALCLQQSNKMPSPSAALLAAQKERSTLSNKIKTGSSKLKLIVPKLQFSARPTDLEIETARLFAEPLVPMTTAAVSGENEALAKAMVAHKQANNVEDQLALTNFIAAYPNSRWRPALELNLGLARLHTGHLSQALSYWQSAWALSKHETGAAQIAIANRAVAKLLLTHGRLGHVKQLKELLAEVGKRPFFGSDNEMETSARQGLALMQTEPQKAFNCGPLALFSILSLHPPVRTKGIDLACSTSDGTNLTQVNELAKKVGMKYQMAKRSKEAPVVVPCVMHWSASHFCAITSSHNGIYILKDPTFDNDGVIGLTSKTVDEETDGYFLVPAGSLPSGWHAVDDNEGKTVWGKGAALTCDNNSLPPCGTPCCNGSGGPGGGANGGSGGSGNPMAQASFRTMPATLTIRDTPVSYTPPLGPTMDAVLDYEQVLPNQPSTWTFTNFGLNWRYNWLSYLTIDPLTSVATIRTPGDGSEIATPTGGVYPPNWLTQAVLVNMGGGVYQRNLPSGASQVYSQPDGAGNIFMTKVIDAQGNVVTIQYDASFRISTITDAINQVTTLSYVSNTVGNSGFYKVASIQDPFGRSANFAYDSTNTNLVKITDVIGLQSQFNYDTSSTMITAMTTAYGTSSFQQYLPFGSSLANGLRTTYPDGSYSVVENWLGEPKITYYWDREATAMYPADPANKIYTHSVNTRFQVEPGAVEAPVKQSEAFPLENTTVNYFSPGQPSQNDIGTLNKPSQITRNIAVENVIATIGGTITVGDIVTITIPGRGSVNYTVVIGDTINSIAANLANLINTSAIFQAQAVTAIPSLNTITLSAASQSVVYQYSSTGTETIALKASQRQTLDVNVVGTVTAGNVLTTNFQIPYTPGRTINYTVQATDTLTTIAANIAALVNADTTLQSYGITAVSTGPTFTVLSYLFAQQVISLNWSGGATATLVAGNVTGGEIVSSNYQYNALGKVTKSTDSANRQFSSQYAANNIDLTQITETQNADNFLIGAWTYNSAHRPLTYEDGSGQITHYAYNSSGQLISITDANSNVTTMTYTGTSKATIGGTKTTGNVLTITVHDAGLTGGQKAINYTVLAADTLSTIATHLASAITADTDLQAIGVSATAASTVITLSSTSVNVTTYTESVTGTETITLGTNTFGYLTKVDGPLSGNKDVTTFSYDAVGRLASRTDSENYTVNYSYDNADRLTQTTYPDGTTEQIVYDRLDAVFKKDRIGRWTQDSFDQLDQLAFEIDPLGRQTTYTWCICGALHSLTDGNGHTTSWQRDLQGRVTQKIYPDNTSVKYLYDPYISRLIARIDALGQKTVYTYNSDNTPEQVGYLNAVNATGAVTYAWDLNFKRLTSVTKSDWGAYTYTYNNYIAPGGGATTGGGMLQLVHNNVIPNSDVSYSYDALARTTNRSINGASNSDTWTYDAMSRITNETNALGSFGYNYVDDVSGSSKGTLRLSSINYPNSQVTNFNWYPNIGDQRLQQITNSKTAGGTLLSQFNYGYDSAGQITQWQQQQNGNNLFYNLGYDQAGQLTSAQAGSGGPQSPPASEFYYSYDAGANRTAVQTAGMQTIRVGGTKTTGNVLTITVKDAALAGGQEAVSYTVLAADTLASIAQALAAAINQDVNLHAIGVVANAHGTNTFVNIRSASNNLTTYATSTSGGATETLTAGIFKNGLTNAAIGGSKTTSDVLTVTVKDAALTGGQQAISYTVLSSDTLSTIATAIKNAINANANLSTLGVTATVASAVVSISSTSVNATTYSSSTNTGATETVSLTANNNPQALAIVGGAKTTGDVLTLNVYDPALTGGKQANSYTVLATDTLATIAAGLAAAINASTALQNIGVTSSASGTVVTISSNSVNQTSYRQSYSTGATESVLLTTPTYGWQVAALGGTKTTGNVLTLTAYNALLTGGQESVSYTVLAADTLSTIATGLAAAVNADANLSAIGITATASAAVVNLESVAPALTTYSQSTSTGATETIAMSTGYGVQQSSYNSVNELVSISGGGAAQFNATTDKPVKSASVSTQVIKIQSPLPAVTTSYAASVSKTPTETFTVAEAPGTVSSADAYLFTIGGTPNPGDVISITFNDVRFVPGPSETVSYTVAAGDTLNFILNGLVNAINNDAVLQTPGIFIHVAAETTTTMTVAVPHGYNPPAPIGISTSVTSTGSETVSFGLAADENTSATIGGTVTSGDIVQVSVSNSRLASGVENVSHTVGSSETTTTIASALATAINSDANLQAIGIGAASTGPVLTLAAYTYFTTSVGTGTETLTVSNANRGSANISVGGVPKTGDVLSITAHDAALTGGQETVSYTVLSTDTLLSIAQALGSAINADAHLQALNIAWANSVNLTNSQAFAGNASLPAGNSLAAASATDGSNNTKTNGYAFSVNGGSSSTLSYDLNGNMTSDGTNSYSWDAEDRMIKVTYPGTNNFSSFVYDGYGRNISIVETAAGSVTSTKQFVWAGDKIRPYQACEARNAAGAISAQYFILGESLSSTSYFYTADQLANPPDFASHFLQSNVGTGLAFSPMFTSSIREMTDSSGTIQTQLGYDLYGRTIKLQGTLSPDFQFGDYYLHAQSGLSLTLTRPYSSKLGRFLNRDRIAETSGLNLYAYMNNHPEVGVDPSGKCALAIPLIVAGPEAAIAAGALGAAAVGEAAALGTSIGGFINAMNGPTGSGAGSGANANAGAKSCKPPDCNPPVFDPSMTYKKCALWCVNNCTPPGNLTACLNKCGPLLGESNTAPPIQGSSSPQMGGPPAGP